MQFDSIQVSKILVTIGNRLQCEAGEHDLFHLRLGDGSGEEGQLAELRSQNMSRSF
jgi:hypothetical protein